MQEAAESTKPVAARSMSVTIITFCSKQMKPFLWRPCSLAIQRWSLSAMFKHLKCIQRQSLGERFSITEQQGAFAFAPAVSTCPSH